MTLQQFFNWVQDNPMMVLYYFIIVFLITIVLNSVAEQKGHLYPWSFLYSCIIFLVCVPGIFALTLNIYFFLFEKQSIMEANLLIQALPLMMMFVIIYFVKKNVDLDYIPGFDKLYALMWIIGIVLSLMWVIDRTHLYAISFIPFSYVLILLATGIVLLRYLSRKFI